MIGLAPAAARTSSRCARRPGTRSSTSASSRPALLFWWPVVQPWPSRAALAALERSLRTCCSPTSLNTVLAAFLAFSERVLYPAYDAGAAARSASRRSTTRSWPGAHVGARLARVPGSGHGDHRGGCSRRAARRPARRPTPRPAGRSGPSPRVALRSPAPRRSSALLLRARYGRRALQAVMLLLAAAVVADGLLGPSDGADEPRRRAALDLLARASRWSRCSRPATSSAWPARSCCRASWAGASGSPRRSWPRAAALEVAGRRPAGALLLGLRGVRPLGQPAATAWIVVALLRRRVRSSTRCFRGASFCKYVCPIGQFHFVGSLVSPLEVTVREPDACAALHDARLPARQRRRSAAARLDLFLPRKAGNLDCTFCLDCVHACPHDNVGILIGGARPRSRPRSRCGPSLGRLSRRPDVAALALVFVVAAFTSGAAMVTSIGPGLAVPVAALVFVPWAGTMAWAARGRARLRSSGQVLCRLALALVPLGLSMWSAHVLFHLLTGWSSALAGRSARGRGRRRACAGGGELGRWSRLSSPRTGCCGCRSCSWTSASWSRCTWAGGSCAARARASALGPLVPWVAVAVSLYAVGVWTFLQPMAMRGMVH